MTWLIWRQQRVQVLSSIGIVLGFIGLWTVLLVETSECKSAQTCDAPIWSFVSSNYSYFGMASFGISIVLGVFAGAPLFAREFEEGTHAFVLTQSGRLGKWIVFKLLVASAPVAVLLIGLGIVSAVVHERAWLPMPLLQPLSYNANGPLLAGWFMLAFSFASLLGVIGRRTLLAMVLAVVAFVPTTVLVSQFIRPPVLPPEEVSIAVTEDGRAADMIMRPDPPAGATIIDGGFLDAAGDKLPYGTCFEGDCLEEIAVSYTVYYFDSHFWLLQVFDIAVYTLIVAGVLAATIVFLRRHRLLFHYVILRSG